MAFITHYEIMSIDNIVCLPGTGILRLVMNVNVDLSPLLPYINGYVKKSHYLPQINWIRFPFSGYPKAKGNWNVAIKNNEIIIAKFNDSTEAKEIAFELINYLNYIYDIKDSLKPDYTPWNPPKVFDILSCLPKTNCKKCGYLSCMAFATKLVEGEVDISLCKELEVGGSDYLKLLGFLDNS